MKKGDRVLVIGSRYSGMEGRIAFRTKEGHYVVRLWSPSCSPLSPSFDSRELRKVENAAICQGTPKRA